MPKQFSVLLPVVDVSGEQNVLFEVRSRGLRHHAGEISFPGGALEAGEDALEAAIRETSEELGINRDTVEITGSVQGTYALNGNYISCYTGRLHTGSFIPSEAEVEELFDVPLSFLLEAKPKCHFLENHLGEKVKSYIYEYDGRVIWGITARLLKNFLDSYDKQ